MATNEERMQILKMIQSGQITAEDGAKLLAALKARKRETGFRPEGARWVRVRVTDTRTGRSKMTISLPMSLVNLGFKIGERFIPESEELDLEELREKLNSGIRGKILDAKVEEENQRLEIFLE